MRNRKTRDRKGNSNLATVSLYDLGTHLFEGGTAAMLRLEHGECDPIAPSPARFDETPFSGSLVLVKYSLSASSN
jgi:hypothetical protein